MICTDHETTPDFWARTRRRPSMKGGAVGGFLRAVDLQLFWTPQVSTTDRAAPVAINVTK